MLRPVVLFLEGGEGTSGLLIQIMKEAGSTLAWSFSFCITETRPPHPPLVSAGQTESEKQILCVPPPPASTAPESVLSKGS